MGAARALYFVTVTAMKKLDYLAGDGVLLCAAR